MTTRKPLKPNNRSLKALRASMVSGASRAKSPKSKEEASVFTYLRPGGPVDGSVGGGNRVGKRQR